MARVVVLGAGIAGHTAALVLRRNLPREHVVTVVSPKPTYNWIPSNISEGFPRVLRRVPRTSLLVLHGEVEYPREAR